MSAEVTAGMPEAVIQNILLLFLFLVLFFWLLAFPISAFFVVRVSYPRWLRRISGEPDFPVHVIVPCRDASAHLEGNLRAFASQDYSRYIVTFVTSTQEDGANAVIRSVARGNHRVRHLVAGMSERCSAKAYAEIVAVESDRQSAVFLFGDSDLRPGPDWVREMVRPFLDPGVSVTTAHRWISPGTRGLASLLYTILGGVHCMEIAVPFLTQVWGGAVGITRTAYGEMGVRELWSTTVSDDVALSNRMAERHIRPFFVPRGVSTSQETPRSLKELRIWYTRWFLTGKLYEFLLWLAALTFETLVSLTLAGSVLLVIVETATGSLEYHALAAPVIVASIMANTLIMKLTYRRRTDIPLWQWMTVPLIGHFIVTACIWGSAFQNAMTWGSFTYTVNRDGKLVARRPAAGSSSQR